MERIWKKVSQKKTREEKSWSQNKMAKRLDVNQASINQVEFVANPTHIQVMKITGTLVVGV